MLEIPGHITLIFILTTVISYVLFVMSSLFSYDKKTQQRSIIVALLVMMWLIFQSTLALNKWYMDRTVVPPHLAFPLITCTVIVVLLFLIPGLRYWTDRISIRFLTWLHIVRIPVELCLYWLAIERQIPWSMTFEGYNFDIAIGITAPVVAVLHFQLKRMNSKIFIVWNVLGLLSVLAVVIRGIGAVPSPFQKWDFTQPNYAVMHFPFIWLVAFIVPVVIFAHINAIRRTVKKLPY